MATAITLLRVTLAALRHRYMKKNLLQPCKYITKLITPALPKVYQKLICKQIPEHPDAYELLNL